uniref:Copia protein n=1 Tax=Tanacetum cinerariifolium TaxID=118510 RepID=A0A699J1Z5_TANCI|nr:copia protein [Tanacetum cinerariifolium]
METGSTQYYIFMPLWKEGLPLFDSSPKISHDARSPLFGDAKMKHDEVSNKESGALNKLNSAFDNFNNEYPDDPKIPGLETIAIYDDYEEEADFTNSESLMHVSPTPTTITHKNHPLKKGHTQEEGMDYDEVFAPVVRIKAIRLFLAYASFIGFMVYQMSAFLYERIEEEVYVCQPPGFKDLDHPNKVYKVVKALYGLHQAPRAWVASEAKRRCHPKLGLGYLRDSLFELVAYTDSDYARASLDRKSTTGGCQFLRSRLISWQCKKQNVVATSTIEAEYVAATSCYKQVLWIQNQMLDYGYNLCTL